MKKWALLAATLGISGLLAYAGMGCTVTTDDSGLDGGLFDPDGSSDTGSTADSGDSGTTDSESDAGNCPIIGSDGVDFGSETCNSCMSNSCCEVTIDCFANAPDGGKSECTSLAECVQACFENDAGVDPEECAETCANVYGDDVIDQYNAIVDCQEASCVSECQ